VEMDLIRHYTGQLPYYWNRSEPSIKASLSSGISSLECFKRSCQGMWATFSVIENLCIGCPSPEGKFLSWHIIIVFATVIAAGISFLLNLIRHF
jgi:hypothetical protein